MPRKWSLSGSSPRAIAHDCNNLLMAIPGTGDVSKISIGLEPANARQIATVQHWSCSIGASLTRQMLVFGHRQTLFRVSSTSTKRLHGIEGLLAATPVDTDAWS